MCDCACFAGGAEGFFWFCWGFCGWVAVFSCLVYCCVILSIAPLSCWLFVFCALFVVQAVKRGFPVSFSIAKCPEKSQKVPWGALFRAALARVAIRRQTCWVFLWIGRKQNSPENRSSMLSGISPPLNHPSNRVRSCKKPSEQNSPIKTLTKFTNLPIHKFTNQLQKYSARKRVYPSLYRDLIVMKRCAGSSGSRIKKAVSQ